jgi:co-chaperonin GroES (HSP10)
MKLPLVTGFYSGLEAKEKTKGGILLPIRLRKGAEGKIIAVGEGKKNDEEKLVPLSVKSATWFYTENIQARR